VFLFMSVQNQHNWHWRLPGLPQLRGYGLKVARPVVGYVPPAPLDESVELGIPPGPMPQFLPEFPWILGPTFQSFFRKCLTPQPVWTHLVPAGVGV